MYYIVARDFQPCGVTQFRKYRELLLRYTPLGVGELQIVFTKTLKRIVANARPFHRNPTVPFTNSNSFLLECLLNNINPSDCGRRFKDGLFRFRYPA